MNRKLSEIKSRVDQLAKIIEASPDVLPTYGYSNGDALPHVEADSAGYYFVIAERGTEFERHLYLNTDEILYAIFENVTLRLAHKYESSHRIQGQDSRLIIREKQEELMTKLSPSWGYRVRFKQI
jgi:hypothetical protein